MAAGHSRGAVRKGERKQRRGKRGNRGGGGGEGIVIESSESKGTKKKIEQDLRAGPLNRGGRASLSALIVLINCQDPPSIPGLAPGRTIGFYFRRGKRETILDRNQPAYVAIISVNRSRFAYRATFAEPDLSSGRRRAASIVTRGVHSRFRDNLCPLPRLEIAAFFCTEDPRRPL